MTKGKYGLNLSALAILGFILCFFGFTEVLVLLVAYAVILEKDPWLIRQTLQALFLRITLVVATTVVGWIFTLLQEFFGLFKLFSVSTILLDINNFIDLVLTIAAFVFALLAVIKLLRDQDAGLPGLGSLADYTMGIFKKTAPAVPVAPAAPVTPVYPTPAAPAYQPPPPAPAAPAFQPTAQAVPAAPAYQPPAPAVTPPPPLAAEPAVPEIPVEAPAQTPAEAVAPVEPEPAEAPKTPVEPAATPAQEPAPQEQPAQPAAPPLAPGHWICTCGRENYGNFCISCGQPRRT